MKEDSGNTIMIESPHGVKIKLLRRGAKRPRWSYAFNWQGKHRQSTKTDNLAQAKKIAIERAEALYMQDVHGITERQMQKAPPLRNFWPEYLEQYAVPHKEEKTVKRDVVSARQLLEFFGDARLDEIDKKKVARFQAYRKRMTHPKNGRPITHRAINIETNLLAAVLNVAEEWGVLEANPLRKYQKLQEDPGRTRYLREEEWQRISSELVAREEILPPESVTSRLRLYLVVAVGTAMRPDELCNLEWRDVDFSGKTIIIRDSKTDSSRRVPMSDPVAHAIRKMQDVVKTAWPFCPYVFPDSEGAKSRSYTYGQAFRKLVKKLRIPDVRFYDTRHTGASWMFQKGVDLFVLQEILGHKSLTTTRRYSHMNEQMRVAAVDSISDRLGKAQAA